MGAAMMIAKGILGGIGGGLQGAGRLCGLLRLGIPAAGTALPHGKEQRLPDAALGGSVLLCDVRDP